MIMDKKPQGRMKQVGIRATKSTVMDKKSKTGNRRMDHI